MDALRMRPHCQCIAVELCECTRRGHGGMRNRRFGITRRYADSVFPWRRHAAGLSLAVDRAKFGQVLRPIAADRPVAFVFDPFCRRTHSLQRFDGLILALAQDGGEIAAPEDSDSARQAPKFRLVQSFETSADRWRTHLLRIEHLWQFEILDEPAT